MKYYKMAIKYLKLIVQGKKQMDIFDYLTLYKFFDLKQHV